MEIVNSWREPTTRLHMFSSDTIEMTDLHSPFPSGNSKNRLDDLCHKPLPRNVLLFIGNSSFSFRPNLMDAGRAMWSKSSSRRSTVTGS